MNNRVYSFDLLRIFLMIAIVCYHINFLGKPVLNQGYLAVEVFFVLSGFLLAGSFTKYVNIVSSETDLFKTMIRHKIKRLYPEYLFVTIVVLVISPFLFHENLSKDIFFNLIMYGHLGLMPNIVAGSWFVGALFWSSFLLIALMIKYRESFFMIFCPFLFLGTVLMLFNTNMTSLMRASDLIYHIFPSGLLRGVAGLSVGCMTYYIYAHRWYQSKILNFLTLTASLILIRTLFKDKTSDIGIFNIYFLSSFVILGCLVLDHQIKKVSDNIIVRYFSKISYMLFLTNILTIRLIFKFFPQPEDMKRSWYTLLVVVGCVLLAMIFYHIQKYLAHVFYKYIQPRIHALT